MKVFKEDIDNLDNIDQVNGTMPVVMADAKKDSQKNDAEAESRVETDLKKLANQKAFLGAKKQPVPKEPEMAKINLDEDLFDSLNESVASKVIKMGKFVDEHWDEIIDALQQIGVTANELYKIIYNSQQKNKQTEGLDESVAAVAAVKAGTVAAGKAIAKAGPYVAKHWPQILQALEAAGVTVEAIYDIIQTIRHKDTKAPIDKSKLYTIGDAIKKSKLGEAAPVAPKEHGLKDRQGKYYSDEDRSNGIDKSMKKDLWTIVYDELCPVSINIMNKTKFPNARLSDRYGATGRCYSDGEKITVYAKDEAGLKHAYDVAEYYDLECTLPKKEFFKDPDKQVSCTLVVPS